ncbi:hypothetical protein ACP4OV_007310 [Aristida adscensionis]
MLLLRAPVVVDELEEEVVLPGGCDYFVYRPGDPPSLRLIPNPEPYLFLDADVCILPRGHGGGDEPYTIAALVDAAELNKYEFCLFDSEAWSWSSRTVSMAAPRRPYPVKIPNNAVRLHHHATSTVIALGGEAATMGWVDLWSGILLYDLLGGGDLRHMPLPLPMYAITFNHGLGVELGDPRGVRGIAAVAMDGGKASCLMFAELRLNWECLPHTDIETRIPAFVSHGWTLTLWSNTNMAAAAESSSSFVDWHEDFTVRAAEVKIGDAVRSELLGSGLLHRKPSRHGEGATELALQNLFVSHPAPSLNGEADVVYVLARPKYLYHKVWALALDMRSGTLVGVAEFGIENERCGGVTYHPSTMSSYMSC